MNKLLQLAEGRRIQFVDAVDGDGVGFFKLLAENVGGLGREARGRLAAEDLQTVARLEQNGIRCDLEACAVEVLQRLDNGSDQVGATADRLGEDDVGTLVGFELADPVDKFVESAAEASPGHFLDGKALRAQAGGIDEILGLVVGDDADFLSSGLVEACETRQRRRLARTQKTADHDKAKAFHQSNSFRAPMAQSRAA